MSNRSKCGPAYCPLDLGCLIERFDGIPSMYGIRQELSIERHGDCSITITNDAQTERIEELEEALATAQEIIQTLEDRVQESHEKAYTLQERLERCRSREDY